MSNPNILALAILFGGALAGGLLLVIAAMPRLRAASLSNRIAPYLQHVLSDGALVTGGIPNAPTMPAQSERPGAWVRRRFRELMGNEDELLRRMGQAGDVLDAASFRGKQLTLGAVGFAACALLVVVLSLSGQMTPPVLLLPIIGGLGATVLVEVRLTSRAKARLARLNDELPTTLEFLGLCLAAGESLLDSLRRVASVGSGELTGEFARVALATSTGSSLAQALEDLSARLQWPQLARVVDHLVSAIERGAPLAGVLQAQAADAREEAKRTIIEQAGRKEIAMMLPLVFMILPLSVIFAVFPALFVFQLG